MTDKEKFIQAIAAPVAKYAQNYGIKVHSPIIAQAILESGWGTSRLAKEHHNYFGMTATKNYTGETTTVSGANNTQRMFRSYRDTDSGIKGYFEFIGTERYMNLRNETDPEKYIDNIIADGYCSDKGYKDELMKIIKSNNLTQYDPNYGSAIKEAIKAQLKYINDLLDGGDI